MERAETAPNRPTLRAKIARAVTAVAVRCSALLGVEVELIECDEVNEIVSASISNIDGKGFMSPQETLESLLACSRLDYPNQRLGLYLVCGPSVASADKSRRRPRNRK